MTTRREYDLLNRLRRVEALSTAANTPGTGLRRLRHTASRPTQPRCQSGFPAGSKRKLEFDYDLRGRRIKKVSHSAWNGSSYATVVTTKYIHDGWTLLAELDASNNVVRGYVWGTDLSGTTQGAGGVGGLLFVKESDGTPHFAAYDGNGNVMGLVKGTDGTRTDTYEYDPFGQPLRATGPMALVNPIRFSTKFTDNETGLLFYGYRYSSPSIGRWLNRDPIGETGGRNLYGSNLNNAISRWDALGELSEGGVWPIPPNIVDPPSGPFSKCRVALRCDDVERSGATIGAHCGLIIDTGEGVCAFDGSGGTTNRRDVTTATVSDATGPWRDLDPSVCICLFSSVSAWNAKNVPRNNLCENSNWNLKCAIKKCNTNIDRGKQNRPIGYDCVECTEWGIGSPEIGGGCCAKFTEVPCPE